MTQWWLECQLEAKHRAFLPWSPNGGKILYWNSSPGIQPTPIQTISVLLHKANHRCHHCPFDAGAQNSGLLCISRSSPLFFSYRPPRRILFHMYYHKSILQVLWITIDSPFTTVLVLWNAGSLTAEYPKNFYFAFFFKKENRARQLFYNL